MRLYRCTRSITINQSISPEATREGNKLIVDHRASTGEE